MKKKRPSFQFYPGDWLHDTRLRMVSPGARGLWIDMMCVMHESPTYGHLMVGDVPLDEPSLAKCLGMREAEVRPLVAELEKYGVFSRDEAGTIFSRRMVADFELSERRAAGGERSLDHPNVPKRKVIRTTPAAVIPLFTDQSASPAREFALWFVTTGLEKELIDKQFGLDPVLTASRENLELAGNMIAAHGMEECKAHALRFFEALKDQRIRTRVSIAGLSTAWNFRELKAGMQRESTNLDRGFESVSV